MTNLRAETALPPGLTVRPLRLDDATAVYRVMADQELADIGMIEIEEADIVADWARPSFDIAGSTVGVFDGDRLVGYAEVSGSGRGDAAVHPEYRGRGIGTHLAGWMQRAAADRGAEEIGMPVPEGSPGDRLLTDLGYRVRWTSWVLKLPVGTAIVDRPLPDGWTVGEASPDQYRELHGVVEDAFLEWSVRDRETFEDFEAAVINRPGSAPWNLRVVREPDGAVAGVGVVALAESEGSEPEAYISRLAVRRELRGRGLAQALMVDAFKVAAEHGAATSCLSTDSRTGALGLYLKVGMEVTSVWVNRGIRVDGSIGREATPETATDAPG